MKLIDLTHATSRRVINDRILPLVVRSMEATYLVPLKKLVTLASVLDLTGRLGSAVVDRADISRTGVADIGGCILKTGWHDAYLAGEESKPPCLSLDAAEYLLGGGVTTVAADFPVGGDAADLLLHNNCIVVHCLSNLSELGGRIVRLVALPLKLEDVFCAEARVIAIEEE